MAGQPKQRALLASDIAAVLSMVGKQKPATRTLLMTGVALACLQPDSASALTLGQLQVKSTLGAPFVATTMARIGSGESLSKNCLSSVASPDGGVALPQDLNVAVSDTSTPGEYPVRISSRTPMYEPMYEIQLKVKCSGNVTFTRDYVVMLNLPMTSPQTQPTNTVSAGAPQEPALQNPAVENTTAKPGQAQPKATVQPQAAESAADTINESDAMSPSAVNETAVNTASPAADPRPYTERFPTPSAPIDTGSEYQVQAGDMLSTIAQRVQDRPEITARGMADIVFQMNPDAFVDNDPNRVRLGAVLRIPSVNEMLADRRQLPAESQPQPADTNELVMESPDLDLAADTAADEIVVENIAPEPQTIPEATTGAIVENAPEAPAEVSAGTNTVAVADVTEAETLPPVAVSAPAVSATEPELEIVVDISDALEPVTDIEQAELVTAAERALTLNTEPNVQPPAAAESDLAEVAVPDEGMTMHPLLIAGLGALLGCILAALLFGRRLLDFLIPGRQSRTRDEAMQTLGLPPQNEEAPSLGDPSLGEPDFTGTAEITDTGTTEDQSEFAEVDSSDLAAEFATSDADANTDAVANTDVDLDVSDTHSDTSLDLDLSEAEGDTSEIPPSMDAPRVSLDDNIEDTFAGELPLERTEKFSAPDFSLDGSEATGEQSELEGTSTMRKLFSGKPKPQESAPAAADEDFAVTEEMPSLDDAGPLDPTSDLQTLAEHADTENPDDKLSRTLTQALGLLEKDYEDEFTASQILEQKDIKAAFAEHDQSKED